MEPGSFPPPPPSQTPPYSEALTQRMKGDTCFICKNKGHWKQDCPQGSPAASPSKAKSPTASSSSSSDIPILHCGCGDACSVLTSTTEGNPNGNFYFCSRRSQSQPSYSEALTQRMKGDTCFLCKNKGHWKQDCPQRSPAASPSKAKSPTASSSDIPILHCGCGDACSVRTSKTERNPNRKYYFCSRCSQFPDPQRKRTGFVGWCDEFTAPQCPCNAGRCRIYTAAEPEHNNRKYFGCRIKKGLGACQFFQWVDEYRAVPAPSEAHRMEIEPPAMGNPDNPAEIADTKDDEIEELLNSKKLDEIMFSLSVPEQKTTQDLQEMVIEDGSGTTSPDSVVEDLSMEEIDLLDQISQNEIITSHMVSRESEIHRRALLDKISQNEIVTSRMASQKWEIRRQLEEFMKRIFAVGDGLSQDGLNLVLGVQVMGWCGRIAFPPSRLITDPPPKPFFCCIFPSLKAIWESNNMAVTDYRRPDLLMDVPSGPGPRDCLSGGFPHDSCPKKTDDGQVTQLLVWLAQLLNGGTINQLPSFRCGGKYMDIFQRTAADVQDEFIAQLDCIDPLDLDLLRNEAVVCFATLGLLHAHECREFICRVMHYIECASSLAKIQRSVDSLQLEALRDRHLEEQKHYEDLSRLHIEKLKACSASEERCRVLKETADWYRKMLSEIERDIARSEAESSELARCLVKVNQEVNKSGKSVETVAREVEEAQRKEMERAAARDALEKAKSLLRQRCTF
ncbi:uncharacterized protein LOC116195494 [Punica granatum]|uniref:Uncharacterized protein LOC116195494 n=1 Tax=Punica granatum TaxID=22663 RepID=A0A6P8C9Z5_PUNGR|nr:uncharacterized protein LOC116195494 [Punica granatum]